MKIVPIILLMILLPTLSLAASQRCADNYNDGVDLYKEGLKLYKAGEKDYEAFDELQGETTKAFNLNRIFKRPQQEDSTDKIIAAVKLLDSAIKKTKRAKPKFERSMSYLDKAQEYCQGDNYKSAKDIYYSADDAIDRINMKLSGVVGTFTFFTPDYSVAKYELLASLVRIGMTDAAIYMIENEEIELNHTPEENRPLLIIAAEHGLPKIAQALIESGVDIDIQNKNGYSSLEIAAIRGDYDLFTYLFNQKASTFQLNGFNSLSKYKTCNLADMVQLSTDSEELKGFLFNADMSTGHPQVLDFLKTRGLIPICNLNPLVAKVNGESIHQSDIDFIFAVKVLPEFYNQNSGQPFPDNQKSQYEKDILNYLIDQQLAAQAAVNAEIEVNSEVIEEHATEIHNQVDNVKTERVRRYIKNELLVQKIIQQEVSDKISIQDDELQQYYDQNPEKFTQSELIHASHILMADKSKIEEVLALAKTKGSDFSELAAEYSEGPSSANGGNLGFFKRGQMVKPFDDSAFALNEGEISDIVETQFGFHIIKLIEKQAGGVIPFTDVKDRIREWMKQRKAAGKVDEWTKALRADATIEIMGG